MISHKHQCIFIHIPKTAGTSISKKLGGFDRLERGVQDHRTIKELEPLTPGDWLRIISSGKFKNREKLLFNRLVRHRFLVPKDMPTREQYHNYFKFTFVRNPWSRVYSWYKNVLRDPIHREKQGVPEGCSFSDFINHHMDQSALFPQTWWIKNWQGKIPLDFIGKFENLQEDFDRVCDILSIKDCQLPHLIDGKTKKRYSEYYTDDLIQTVADLYAEEIERFNFVFPG